jgi:hypothetical protein
VRSIILKRNDIGFSISYSSSMQYQACARDSNHGNLFDAQFRILAEMGSRLLSNMNV